MPATKKRKSNFLTVLSKELRRFFGDRRMLMTMFLPGVLIFIIYTVMGEAFMTGFVTEEGHEYRIMAENLPDSVRSITEASGMPVVFVDRHDTISTEIVESFIKGGTYDLYAVFPANFDAAAAAYDPASGQPAPDVRLYYDSSITPSGEAYGLLCGVLDAYESSLANRFDVNRPVEGEKFDLATDEDMSAMLLSMIMPMLLMTLLFTGCMAVATESIAGEKERGTIATLLVTPMKRWELALGKIAALSVTALTSGVCSFLGTMLSLPRLMGGEEAGIFTADAYGVWDYAALLGVILSTILVFVSLISLVSALASSVKTATSAVSPLMLLVTLTGVTGMFTAPPSDALYLIPVYNSVQAIIGIFSGTLMPVQLILTVVMNLALTGGLVVLLAKLFDSEKVMFSK